MSTPTPSPASPRGVALRRFGAAVAVAGVVLLGGACDANVTTDITVTGTEEASVRVTAVFTDEAAETIAENDAVRDELSGIFSDRTGHDPQITESDGRFEVSDTVSYEELTKVSDLVGIENVSLTVDGGDATLVVQTAAPSKVAQAVETTVASQPDAQALGETMLASTHVLVNVTFPGGISQAYGQDFDIEVDGNTATYTRTADSTDTGKLVVTGDPTPDHWPYYAGAAAAIASIAGAIGVLRRRRR